MPVLTNINVANHFNSKSCASYSCTIRMKNYIVKSICIYDPHKNDPVNNVNNHTTPNVRTFIMGGSWGKEKQSLENDFVYYIILFDNPFFFVT